MSLTFVLFNAIFLLSWQRKLNNVVYQPIEGTPDRRFWIAIGIWDILQ